MVNDSVGYVSGHKHRQGKGPGLPGWPIRLVKRWVDCNSVMSTYWKSYYQSVNV